jgi:hypothetical protein
MLEIAHCMIKDATYTKMGHSVDVTAMACFRTVPAGHSALPLNTITAMPRTVSSELAVV